MKKKLFAILLCLALAVGILPTAVMAEEEDPRYPVVEFTIVKKVAKTADAAAPAAETFAFVLEDTEEVEKKSPATYGIELPEELKIETNGVGDYVKTVKAKIDMSMVNPNGGWKEIFPVGGQTPVSYYKTFHITEKNDAKEGWEYSTAEYAVTFKYDLDTRNMTCGVYEIGNDVTFRTADFINTYTKQAPAAKTVELPFTITVKQGGNVAPGKQTFELETFDVGNSNAHEYADVKVTASVETNGVKDYDGKLVITGPENQVAEFTSEGFYVREKNTGAASWEYSDAVWYVTPNMNDGYDICPAEPKTSDNGDYYDPDRENVAEKMTFVNIYTQNQSAGTTDPEAPTTPDETKAPATGDSGNAVLWIALMFLSGSAIATTAFYSRKRKNAK